MQNNSEFYLSAVFCFPQVTQISW